MDSRAMSDKDPRPASGPGTSTGTRTTSTNSARVSSVPAVSTGKKHIGQDTRERLLTGECLVPDEMPVRLYEEHIQRYAFASRFCAGKIVLDVACGTGYGSHFLAEAGAKAVFGVDISEDALEYASSHYRRDNLFFMRLDASELPFSDGQFDTVCSFETLEHLSAPRRLVSECRRVLRWSGSLICSTPNRSLTSPLWLPPVNPFHVREFAVSETRGMLAEHFSDVGLWGQDFYDGRRAARLALKFGALQLFALLPGGRRLINRAIRNNLFDRESTPPVAAKSHRQNGAPKRSDNRVLPYQGRPGRGSPRYLVTVARNHYREQR